MKDDYFDAPSPVDSTSNYPKAASPTDLLLSCCLAGHLGASVSLKCCHCSWQYSLCARAMAFSVRTARRATTCPASTPMYLHSLLHKRRQRTFRQRLSSLHIGVCKVCCSNTDRLTQLPAKNVSHFDSIVTPCEEADRLDREIEAHDRRVRELAAQSLGMQMRFEGSFLHCHR